MFLPDKVRGYAEALRVLKPGGQFVFSVWDKIEENEFAHLVTEVVGAVFPDDPPLFLARTPHGCHDAGVISDELAAAGFGDVEIDLDHHRGKQGAIASPSGDRLLSGHALAERD